MADAFELLHPNVQRTLWDMRWTELRPIQAGSIRHLLVQGGDCVIASPTASGKTEAAFLPVLSAIADAPKASVRAMYIGPLKALINDQFRRVEELCARLEMPVHKWHGDVDDGARKRLLAEPSGVLLMTPESLEAMFVRRPTAMPALFRSLAYVVVDEMHAFLGTERGAQLVCQLHRLRIRANCDPVRIGLSATLGDSHAALGWLRPGGPAATLIEDTTARTALAIRVKGIWKKKPPNAVSDDSDATDPPNPDPSMVRLARDILLACKGNTNLVFANAKRRIEQLADAMTTQAASMKLVDEIVVHHGSLSKERREYAEARLRAEMPCTAVCSNTLELGIDIGQIDEVIQVSAPWSVASLVQRVGRSGRRANARRVLRGYFVEEFPDETADVWDRLHLEFLQALAIIELMLERFLEAPDLARSHSSTLVQQVLSALAETGGATAASLHARIVGSGAFGRLSAKEFARLLRELGLHELIEQMEDGSLILGGKGEAIVENYRFFAAFNAPEELRVVHGNDVLGTVPEPPAPGEHLILAGRRWRVDEIDAEHRTIFVSPAKGGAPPRFSSGYGRIHPRVHATMRELLASDRVPAYLDDMAKEILKSARETAVRLRQFEPSAQPFETGVRLYLFRGTRVQRTLQLALAHAGFGASDRDVGLEVSGNPSEVLRALRAFAHEPDAEALAAFADEKQGLRKFGAEKFEWCLPPEHWRAVFAREQLDIPAAVAAASTVARDLAALGWPRPPS
ncbi:DEAD/DEAH box helicase [Pendulispora brunnea]|uniref:DEAD/DEAH box helicase n=1 Tax=Pendulispora brunnea TaxID=2905690 RepID=A0ABZ2JYM7_9BACT